MQHIDNNSRRQTWHEGGFSVLTLLEGRQRRDLDRALRRAPKPCGFWWRPSADELWTPCTAYLYQKYTHQHSG